ncbi:MAG: hypothetical protein ACT4PJ_03180 [Gemmatimonadaceae bacterium]
MLHSLPRLAALAAGIVVLGAAPLFAQSTDSTFSTPHVMAAVVVEANTRRASLAENRRLSRDLARYDARIVALEHHLDSLKTYADSLDRDRVYLEAAAAQARTRRAQVEQRLRELESPPHPTVQPSDARLVLP